MQTHGAITKGPSCVMKMFRPGAKVTLGTAGSAGIDLHFYPPAEKDKPLTILPGRSAVLETGIGVDVIQSDETGVCGQIWPRSGLSVNGRIETGAGLIDPDYKGEIMVHLYNHGTQPHVIEPGDRIAQLVLVTFIKPSTLSVCEYTGEASEGIWQTRRKERGAAGFGSTGAN